MANFYVYSGAAGAGTGADWTNAFTGIVAAAAAAAAGDTLYVAHDHAESTASSITITFAGTAALPVRVLCVNRAGSVPPVSADLRTTAVVTTTGASNMLIDNHVYCYGVAFNCGTGASAASIIVNNTGGIQTFEACKMALKTTSSTSRLITGTTTANAGYKTVFVNTTAEFGAVGQGLAHRGGLLEWRDTASAIVGTVPTILFVTDTSARSGEIRVRGVDFSAMGSGKTLVGDITSTTRLTIQRCKLGSSATVCATITNSRSTELDIVNCDTGALVYRNERHRYQAVMTTNTAVRRTGGASDGTTLISWKITPSGNVAWHAPFEAPAIAVWNDTTGSRTATVEGVMNAAALPNNDEVWFDVEKLGDASYTISSTQSGTKADALASGSALTASTEAWDGNATSRANSTAYALGDVLKVASNTGRIFFCTTAGTSAGSEPAGYASAVDGGSVTDGTAAFRAGMRFKQAITFTANLVGPVYVRPKVNVSTAAAHVYIDPKVTLS